MKKRRILYVDATITGNITKISLYDSENNLTNILELIEIKDNNIAELYAVLYAILYVIKNNLSNCHILSDNSQAVQNRDYFFVIILKRTFTQKRLFTIPSKD